MGLLNSLMLLFCSAQPHRPSFGGDVEHSGRLDAAAEKLSLAECEQVGDVHQQEGFSALGWSDPYADFVWADDAFQEIVARWRGIDILHSEDE